MGEIGCCGRKGDALLEYREKKGSVLTLQQRNDDSVTKIGRMVSLNSDAGKGKRNRRAQRSRRIFERIEPARMSADGGQKRQYLGFYDTGR